MSTKPNRRFSFLSKSTKEKAAPATNGNGTANGTTKSAPNGTTKSVPNSTTPNGTSKYTNGTSKSAPNGTTTTNGSAKPANNEGFLAKMKKAISTSSVASLMDLVQNMESMDDRKLFLEHAVVFVAELEPGSEMQVFLQTKLIELLYNDLGHPPPTSISNKYAWRTADGSSNNIQLPDLGKANTPYARSVQQRHPLPSHELPDPGLIFDSLLRRDGFEQHPAGLSSAFFAFAALVIHTCFRTSHLDVSVNETSAYVDLSPLYGSTQEQQDEVRNKVPGLGLLHKDVFAEERLLLLPPAVCSILVLFNRNHNYIAQKLYSINERGTYKDPANLTPEEMSKQDEDIFQTARLVNCGWFGSVVFSDYFSCILGLVRQGSTWSLNPFGEIRNADHSFFERGAGNACSVEFNCLYRWHATTSQKDEQWVEDLHAKLFPGKGFVDVSTEDFRATARKLRAMTPDAKHRTFGDLKRQEDGSFSDEALANILQNATEEPAGAFRARGTPDSMRLHEVMGIEQNRAWGVCSLNDFRRFLGLKPYASFLEWNSNPEVADAAEKLYGNIEYLELYTGLQAEEAKPLVEGAGLCPGYTISRAILSDAIALTRGDRHFTHDYTPGNLTAWGFADCQRDAEGFGFGSTLGRLILRTLPEHYTENSVYTFFPLMLPSEMEKHLTEMKLLDQYDLTRPGLKQGSKTVSDHKIVREVLTSQSYVAPEVAKAKKVITGAGFYTATENNKEATQVIEALANSPEAEFTLAQYFHKETTRLIEQKSYVTVNKKAKVVDVVRDVLKHVTVNWVASEIAGIPLKQTPNDDDGEYTTTDLYEKLGHIYEYIFLEVEASKSVVARQKAQKNITELLEKIKEHMHGQSKLSLGGLSRMFSTKKHSEKHAGLVKNLKAIGWDNDAIANAILALMVGASVELSLSLTNMVNVYLDTEHLEKIVALVQDTTASTKLEDHAREALRIDPPLKGVYRTSNAEQSLGDHKLGHSDRIFIDLVSIYQNPEAYPSPTEVNIERENKNIFGAHYGVGKCLGESLSLKIMAQVLTAIFSLPDVSRGPGNSGKLKRYVDAGRTDLVYAYLDAGKLTCPWPTSLVITYGGTVNQQA